MDRRRIGDDRGAVAVVVALTLTALMLFAAVAVDVGFLFDVRRQLQSAADAAALAGCWEYIKSGDATAADARARQYVALNQVRPATNIVIDAVTIDTAQGSVQVEVHQDTDNFFARLIAPSTLVNAQARALMSKIAGARLLVPWGIPMIVDGDIDYVEAAVVDGGGNVVSGPVNLSAGGPREWVGGLSAPGSAGGYDVRVRVYNIYGVYEYTGDSKGEQPSARVVVDSAAYSFAAVNLSNDYIASDAPVYPTLTVVTKMAQPKVSLEVDRNKRQMTSADGIHWTYTLAPGDVSLDDTFLTTFPVDIYLGNNADGFVDTYVHVRRSTFPFGDVLTAPTVASPGGTIDVQVHLNEFNPTTLEPGKIYTLRVGSTGVESGNFGELDYSKIQHLASCPPDPAGLTYGGMQDWVLEGYPGGVHVGDIIPISPGKSGWTPRLVQDRMDKYGPTIAVPIVSKVEDKTSGRFDVIVRKFAAFNILDISKSGSEKGIVRGEFVQYIATPSGFTNGGPGTVYAPRLVNPN